MRRTMTREELKELGLTDEQIEKIMALNGQAIEAWKAQAEAEKRRADTTQGQLQTLQGELSKAQKSAGDFESLKAQLTKAQADLAGAQKTAKLKDALGAYKPKDAGLLMRLLDADKISLGEDGKLTGLEEQIKPLRESSGYLFADTPSERGGKPDIGGPSGQAFNMNDFLRKG